MKIDNKMEGVYDDFKINDKYFKAIPRPTEDECNALDMKLIERGQMEPIIVNKDMVILDGHTRFDLLTQRGKKVKYVIKEFDNKKDEWNYVVESNVMRRQLNKFQRIEAMYGMYKTKKAETKTKNYDAEIDILNSIKRGNNTARDIARDIVYTTASVNRLCKELNVKGHIEIETSFRKYGHGRKGGTTSHVYKTTNSTDNFLNTHSKKTSGSASVLVGKIIGLNRNTVVKGMTLIEKADESMKKRLRSGNISMSEAYDRILKIKKGTSKGKKYSSHMQCPHCNQIEHKSKFKRIP